MAAYRFALLACCALVLAPAAARADVLEIGAGGATWVSGGPVAAEPAPAALAEVDLAIPEEAVASPAASGATLPARYHAAVHQLAARFDLSPAALPS